jgi:energy-coupling factor transporter transmembrane protein EcfT
VVDSTDVADAMEMRSFGAVRHRSWIRALRYRARDLILIGIGSLGLALAAALSLGWIALPAV